MSRSALFAGIRTIGVIFLFRHGLQSMRQALEAEGLEAVDYPRCLRESILAAMGLSLLKPHVYLDTVVLLGSIGTKVPVVDRPSFSVGAIVTSSLSFFSIKFGLATSTSWVIPASLVADALQ
jgi:L-lysine exporter family protein LysE/ArgO